MNDIDIFLLKFLNPDAAVIHGNIITVTLWLLYILAIFDNPDPQWRISCQSPAAE